MTIKKIDFKTMAIMMILAAVLFIGISFWIATINNENFYKSVLVIYIFFIAFVIFVLIAASVLSKKIKKSSDLLQDQYERFQKIISEIKSVIFNYNIPTQKINVSDNFENIFGYTLSRDWLRNIKERAAEHPEIDFEAILKAKSKVEFTGKSTHIVLQSLNKSGELRWFRIIMTPTFNRRNRINNICGVIIDITDRYDEHQNMMMEQERLTLAIKNLASLVISCNLTQNTFRMINYEKLITKKFSYEGEFDELVDIASSTVPEDDRQKFIDAFSRENLISAYKRGEKKIEIDHKHIGDDGIIRWMRTVVLFVNNHYDEDLYEVTFTHDITESKQYEELLKRTFDLTLENMPCFVGKWMFKDNDVVLLEANKEYLEFLGIKDGSELDVSVFYGLSDDGKQRVMEKLLACEKYRDPITISGRACKMNGEECWIKVQASFFEEKDGKSVYYGTVTDITELISAQQKLSKTVSELENAYAQVTSVNAYRDLMNYSKSGGMIVRTLWDSNEHRFLYVSPGILKICGYTEEEFMTSIVDGVCNILYTDDFQRIAEANQKLKDFGDACTINYRIRHKDGGNRWVIEHAMVVPMPNGEKVIASISVDNTKQKDLEKRLRISQEEYKIAAELSNHAVLSYDVSSHSYEVISNKNETHNFERTKKDVPEYAIQIGAVAPESADLLRKVFDAIDRGERQDPCIIALCTSEGEKYWMDLDYTIIFDDDDNPMTAILTFDDVTSKVQAQSLFNISKLFLNDAKNVVKMIVADLTNKTISYETEGYHGLLANIIDSKDSSIIMKHVANHLIIPADREDFTAFFRAERFIKAYQEGVTEESFEYRGYNADNKSHWIYVQTKLLEDRYTNDIMLYAIFSDINEQKVAELELMRRANTDSLTGLLNRESFKDEIKMCYEGSEKHSFGLFSALLLIDIDKFKNINDIYGHEMGDEVLRQVADRIKESLRDEDTVARFGGDEFIAMMHSMPSIESIHQSCVKVCETLNFKFTDDIILSASIGVAVCPEDGKDFSTLFQNADIAMFQAKKAGGNRCARYTYDGMQQIVPEKTIETKYAPSNNVFVRTFGFFDIFLNSKPVYFKNAKEKELLAILVDRNGEALTEEEAISILWKEEVTVQKQNLRYRELAMSLIETLRREGIDKIIVANRGIYNIDKTKLECDYFLFLNGNSEFRKIYHGSYMTNYSWSKETTEKLDKMI